MVGHEDEQTKISGLMGRDASLITCCTHPHTPQNSVTCDGVDPQPFLPSLIAHPPSLNSSTSHHTQHDSLHTAPPPPPQSQDLKFGLGVVGSLFHTLFLLFYCFTKSCLTLGFRVKKKKTHTHKNGRNKQKQTNKSRTKETQNKKRINKKNAIQKFPMFYKRALHPEPTLQILTSTSNFELKIRSTLKSRFHVWDAFSGRSFSSKKKSLKTVAQQKRT